MIKTDVCRNCGQIGLRFYKFQVSSVIIIMVVVVFLAAVVARSTEAKIKLQLHSDKQPYDFVIKQTNKQIMFEIAL